MSKRIKQNFYTLRGYSFEKIPKEDREKLKNDKYWSGKEYWHVEKSLPDNRLYAGWGFRYPTKLTPEDLPEDFIYISNYKKCGYIRTSGVKSLVYHPSYFHNHAFKDDFLYISYSKDLGEYKHGYEDGSTYKECDEYIFGDDIIYFIAAVDKYSPEINTEDIKKKMVEQYNLYCDEMAEWQCQHAEKVIGFEELLR